jgi:hypothetical protein
MLLALAVFAIYGVLWRNAPFRDTDTTDYLTAAHAIAHGDFSIEQPRTPGLPLFFLLVGTGRLFFFVSLLLHLVAVALLALVMRSAGVRPSFVRLFVLVSMLPPLVQKDAYLLTEGLFEFLMVAGVAGLWLARSSAPKLLLSGLAFALASITRPQNQLLPVVISALIVLYFGWKPGIRYAAFLLLPSVVLVGGLIANNYFRFHDANLTYTLGYHFGTRTVDLFDDIPDPQVRNIMVAARNQAYADHSRSVYWTTHFTRHALMQATGKSPAALARYMLGIHLYLIRTHPLAYLEEVGRGLVHIWFPEVARPTNRPAPVYLISILTQGTLTILFWLTFVVWAGLSLASLFMPIPNWLPDPFLRWMYAVFMTAILYTALVCTAIDMGEPRYRTTVDLAILFVIVVGVNFLVSQRSRAEDLVAESQTAPDLVLVEPDFDRDELTGLVNPHQNAARMRPRGGVH